MDNFEEILNYLIDYVLISLEETYDKDDDFNIGQTYGYVSVLEAIQSRCTKEQLKRLSLLWDIEDVYKIK